MSDGQYQRANSPSNPKAINNDVSHTTSMISESLSEKPSSREMIIGLGLFSFSISLYSVYCMLIKVMLGTYQLTVPELNYYISFVMVILFYFFVKFQHVDIFAVPKAAQRDLLLRCIFGVLSDILLFAAFEFTSFLQTWIEFSRVGVTRKNLS